MTGVTGDAAETGFFAGGLIVREELAVDRLRHLEHPARGRLTWIVVAREVAAEVAEAARDAERDVHVLHLGLELRRGETFQDLDGRRIHDLRPGRIGLL